MKALASAAVLVLAASPALAQPKFINANVQERPAGNLARTFQELIGQPGPVWVGYMVPSQGRDWNTCGCDRVAELEGPGKVAILYRIEDRQAAKVRPVSEPCEVDAGSRTVYWLTGVQPAQSVALLKSLVQVKGALAALALHEAPEAVTTLIDLARNGVTSSVRSDALFWVAQRAGRKAAGTITDAIDNDPDTKVKERAVFALSQLPKDEGIPRLIDVARRNANPRVRRQAMFWLGQSKDPRALQFFEEILAR